MLADITIGQYYPSGSFIHRMDARVKIIILIALIVLAFTAKSVASALLVALVSLFCVTASGVPVGMYFKSLRAIWFLVVLTAILNVFYIDGSVLWSWGPVSITFEGIRQSCFIILRLVCLILLSSVLTFTSTPTELTGAIESLLSPLKIFGVKVHELAMMMTIALRFVPTLLEEAEKIMSAQKARGADLESGGLLKRVKALIPILIPLFVSAFRRAYDLALAMECRCYTDGKGRTRLNEMHIRFSDVLAMIFTAAACAGVAVLNRVYLPDALPVLIANVRGYVREYIRL